MMGPEEILVEFRRAKDKAHQIEVLADLNAVAPRAIAKIIDDAGELLPAGLAVKAFSARYDPVPPVAAPTAKPGRPKTPPLDEGRALTLFREGLTDEAIADQLGVKVYKVYQWRKAEGLRRDYSWHNYSSQEVKVMKKNEKAKDAPETAPAAEAVDDLSNYHVEPPKAASAEPPLTLSRLWAALNRMMTPDLLNAELRINGRADVDVRGYEVKVANNRVYVDLFLRGQEGA